MVMVNPDNCGEYSMDGIEKENLDLIRKKVFQDWDMTWIFGGIEGGGKSTKAFQTARYLSGKRFTLDHVCFSPEDFIKKMITKNFLKAGDCLVLDEGFTLNSRASLSQLNKLFLSVMSECRQKNLFLIVIIPNFFDLDKNLALWRSRGLYYIYHDKMNRGFFRYYNYERKKKLYLLGKKLFDYNKVKPNFFGRFSSYMPFDKEEYKKRKLHAFEHRERKPHETKHMMQRNLLIKKCIEFGMSQREIANYLTEKGFPLTQRGVSKAISSENLVLNYNKLLHGEESDRGEA